MPKASIFHHIGSAKKSQHPLKCCDYELLDKLELNIYSKIKVSR